MARKGSLLAAARRAKKRSPALYAAQGFSQGYQTGLAQAMERMSENQESMASEIEKAKEPLYEMLKEIQDKEQSVELGVKIGQIKTMKNIETFIPNLKKELGEDGFSNLFKEPFQPYRVTTPDVEPTPTSQVSTSPEDFLVFKLVGNEEYQGTRPEPYKPGDEITIPRSVYEQGVLENTPFEYQGKKGTYQKSESKQPAIKNQKLYNDIERGEVISSYEKGTTPGVFTLDENGNEINITSEIGPNGRYQVNKEQIKEYVYRKTIDDDKGISYRVRIKFMNDENGIPIFKLLNPIPGEREAGMLSPEEFSKLSTKLVIPFNPFSANYFSQGVDGVGTNTSNVQTNKSTSLEDLYKNK
jgi:hypothetical protein